MNSGGNYLNKYKIHSAPSSHSIGGSSTNNWVSNLKRTLNVNKQSTPKLPKPINFSQYSTPMTTIKDIEKKYGFDFSRNYAEQQAKAEYQSKRDEIQTARDRLAYESEQAKEGLQHDYFHKFRDESQSLANRGMNAGIAAEGYTQLDFKRQRDLASILSEEQLKQQELDRRASTIEKEEQMKAESIYNERLSQGFGHALDLSRFQQSENQWRAQMAMQQRAQRVEEAWREHQFNNMSYTQKMKLIADAEKYGLDQAWERHKFEAGLAYQASAKALPGMSGKAVNNIQVTQASNTAYQTAMQMGLRLTSGYRDPAHNKRVGGSPTSNHVKGRAYDFAGTKAQMDAFARWAKQSGMFREVLWQVKGHYDHVHIAW